MVPCGHGKQSDGLALVTVSLVIPLAKKATVYSGHLSKQVPLILFKSGKDSLAPVFIMTDGVTYFKLVYGHWPPNKDEVLSIQDYLSSETIKPLSQSIYLTSLNSKNPEVF